MACLIYCPNSCLQGIWRGFKKIYLSPIQVYFGMLDALLAEEKIPEEYSGQIQVDYVLHASLFVILEYKKFGLG